MNENLPYLVGPDHLVNGENKSDVQAQHEQHLQVHLVLLKYTTYTTHDLFYD